MCRLRHWNEISPLSCLNLETVLMSLDSGRFVVFHLHTTSSLHCGFWGGYISPGHIVLDGNPTPSPQRGTATTQFSAYICCGQMATWIKMPLGMELGLGPGDFVLDEDPAPLPQKGAEPSKISAHVYCGQTAGWIKMVLGMDVGLSPGDFVLQADPAPSQQKGAEPPLPKFRPISIVTKRLDASRCQLVWR